MIKRTREVRKETTTVDLQNYELTTFSRGFTLLLRQSLKRWLCASVVNSQPMLKGINAAILSKV